MATDSPVSDRSRLISIDALRGLAALAVVFTHVPHSHGNELGWMFLALLPLDFGTFGVPLFIVLSGFCIHLGMARKIARGEAPRAGWIPFWKRRFWRLYPPYLAAMVYSTAILCFAKPDDAREYLGQFRQFGLDLISHLFLFHNLTRDFWNGMSNSPFWSLGLEEQLYGLFFVMLVLRAKMSAYRVLKISLLVTLLWRFGIPLVGWLLVHVLNIPRAEHVVTLGPYVFDNWTMWPIGWWFLWVLGAVAAEVWCGLVRLPNWCYSRSLMVGLLMVSLVTHKALLGRFAQYWLLDEGLRGVFKTGLEMIASLSDPLFAVACLILLVRWLNAEKNGTFRGVFVNGLARIGLFSYSLYLIHVPLIYLLGILLPSVEHAGIIVRMLVYVPACVAFAWCFFQLVEKHFLGKPKRSTGSETPSITVPT